MIKKIVALAATALFSLNATAGYVQYDFSGPITGHFIQHDDDLSIADYRFYYPVTGLPVPSQDGFSPIRNSGDGYDTNTAASTYFMSNGPTNFSTFDNFNNDGDSYFSVKFSQAVDGKYAYTAQYSLTRKYTASTGSGFDWYKTSGELSGFVTSSAVSASTARDLDAIGGYHEGVSRRIPAYIAATDIPEPASIALMALGGIGIAGALRRRKNLS